MNALVCSGNPHQLAPTHLASEQPTHLTTAEAAKFAAQQVIFMKSSSSVSRMRRRYGLSLAASDLWKLASNARSNTAPKVNCSVSGDVTVYDSMRVGSMLLQVDTELPRSYGNDAWK